MRDGVGTSGAKGRKEEESAHDGDREVAGERKDGEREWWGPQRPLKQPLVRSW